ncbi:hypothetical protein WME99_45900 [Sorangium sp. So ce136]|uniref:hypothetical protein n=1 Tax=Sorangium sp. So ce136 TaxID=3133284 RepID=UPI003F0CF873
MGHPDQFIKRTFAEETALITGGAVEWRDPPEKRLIKVQGDGPFPCNELQHAGGRSG